MRNLIKKILNESDFDWAKNIEPLFMEDSLIIFDKTPTKIEWDGLMKFIADEIGNHTFSDSDYQNMKYDMINDDGYVLFIEPNDQGWVLTHSDKDYIITNEYGDFVKYELSEVLDIINI